MTQNDEDLTEAQARAIMSRLGRAEGELAASFAIPLSWIIREENGQLRARNGTAFAMSAGDRVFGVTACHVLEGWRRDCEQHHVVGLGRLPKLVLSCLAKVVRCAVTAAMQSASAGFAVRPRCGWVIQDVDLQTRVESHGSPK